MSKKTADQLGISYATLCSWRSRHKQYDKGAFVGSGHPMKQLLLLGGIMIIQNINGIEYKLKKPYNFSFLSKYGKVFKVFDDQNSGNICFGIEKDGQRYFVKYAGAPTAKYAGLPEDAINRLVKTLSIYKNLNHPNLIKYVGSEYIGTGFALVFKWADGECMGRMYEASHKRIMELSIDVKLNMFSDIIQFLEHINTQGYVAIDFYDGSIMYDTHTSTTTICDIDFFEKKPYINSVGRLWGSKRFMSPEEYRIDSTIDEITNVFTLGRMGFSLFTDSNYESEEWVLSHERFCILMKATSPERDKRFSSIEKFRIAWITQTVN